MTETAAKTATAIPTTPEETAKSPSAPIIDAQDAATADVQTPATPSQAQSPSDLIAEYNRRLDTEGTAETGSKEEALPAADDVAVADVQTDETAVKDAVAAADKTLDAPGADAEGVATATATETARALADAAIPFDAFVAQKNEYLETVEVTPEIEAIFNRYETELANKNEVLSEIEGVANKDMLLKLGSAMNRLFETEIDEATNNVVVNAEPLIELMRTEFKDEFRPIMEKGLSSYSAKYEGVSVLEEILIDNFGGEKATKMIKFGFYDQPLPVIPAEATLPSTVDTKNKEAFWQLPEIKRQEIRDLTNDLIAYEEEFKAAYDYEKVTLGEAIANIKAKLDAEMYALSSIQQRYDNERHQSEMRSRQQEEAFRSFRGNVNETYNAEIFDLADTFAKDIAPRLTYADEDTQLSQARNIMARVNNALSFSVLDNGQITAEPMADFYAKQLADEGIKFDFGKARDLLKEHYKAVENLVGLKSRNASPQHIEIATRRKNKALFDIKAEQKQLLAQLSSRYARSGASAITKQVDAIKKKKQAVKALPRGQGAGETGTNLTPAQRIADYNRRVEAIDGDGLYQNYHS